MTTIDKLKFIKQKYCLINSIDVDCEKKIDKLSDENKIKLFDWGFHIIAKNKSALVTSRIVILENNDDYSSWTSIGAL